MIHFAERQEGYDLLAMEILDEILRSMSPADRKRLLARVTLRLAGKTGRLGEAAKLLALSDPGSA